MPLASYGDLTAAIADWLHRSDLDAVVPSFIALAEARLNRALRMRQQVTSTTLTTVANTQTVALPSDWLQTLRMRLASPDRQIDYLPGAQFQVRYMASETGAPVHFTLEGSSILLGPKPDAAYGIEFVYYAKVPALTAAATTNWLMTAYPDLYLFAALCESAPYIGNDARIAAWETKFRDALEQAESANNRSVVSGSALRMRAR